MTPSASNIFILLLITMPYRRISILYSLGAGTQILNFNLKKCVYLSFKHNIDTVYTLSDITIPCNTCHKDLGIILSSDLNLNDHYKSITARAYKVLGLIYRTILQLLLWLNCMYVSLIRLQLLYCTQIPHLMKDILTIKRIQRHATKYILNDYTSCYI